MRLQSRTHDAELMFCYCMPFLFTAIIENFEPYYQADSLKRGDFVWSLLQKIIICIFIKHCYENDSLIWQLYMVLKSNSLKNKSWIFQTNKIQIITFICRGTYVVARHYLVEWWTYNNIEKISKFWHTKTIQLIVHGFIIFRPYVE